MEDVSPVTIARNEAELELMSSALRGQGHATELLEAGEHLPIPTLLVALGTDEQERDRTLGVSVMPFGEDGLAATDLVQFYVQMPFTLTEVVRTDLLAATAIVNAQMAIGHFAIRGDELFYRYVLATPNDETVDDALLGELVQLVAFHQEHFGDYLEGVIDGDIDLRVLPEVIAQT